MPKKLPSNKAAPAVATTDTAVVFALHQIQRGAGSLVHANTR